MADNTILNPATTPGGDTLASDDIGGVKFQRQKLTLGIDGVNDGDVSSANPLPVSGNVAIAGTATANPVPVGGIFQTTPTTLTNGQVGELHFTPAQNAKIDISTVGGVAPVIAGKLDLHLTQAAFGELLVAQLVPHAAWRFDYGINNILYFTTGTANGGTVTTDQSRARLSTSSATNGIARLYTMHSLRYLPGMGGLLRCTAVFAAGTASSTQIIGIGDTADGFFFGYNGTSFGVMVRRNSVDTWIPSGSWNGSPLGETLNPQFGNIYQIRFQWLGFGVVTWSIYDKTILDYVPVHRLLYPNTNTVTHILNPTLPVFAEIKNTGNNTDLVMYSPSAMAAQEGIANADYDDPLSVYRSLDVPVTIADTSNHQVITIQNKTTFNGLSNRLPIEIVSINLGRSSTAPNATIRTYRNATFAVGLTFTDVDTNNSPIAQSTTATTITSTNVERAYSLSQQTTGANITFRNQEIMVHPGDTYTIGIQDSANNSTDFVVTINWRELF